MISSLKQTNLYKSLKLSQNSHAYLFFSADKVLNNEIALNFASTYFCEHSTGCLTCNGCKQFLSLSHPDFIKLEQDSIKVDDISTLTDKLSTLPVSAEKKVVLILNAEVINEIAQNKLLKSLEEPSEKVVFILTTSKLDKLLPTVLSRLNKIHVPFITNADKRIILDEYKAAGIDLTKVADKDFDLTESVNLCSNSNFAETVETVFNLLDNLNTTADIPKVVSELSPNVRGSFFGCMQEILLSALKGNKKFDDLKIARVKLKFNEKTILKILPLVDEAYKYQNSNVNFTYILDNLLFNILKEKFLCN